jgi:carbamoyltransferase
MKVLGISGRYRNAAAALAVDGRVVAAVSEDSFTRISGIGYVHTGGFPTSAVEACLRSAGLEFGDVDQLTVVEDEELDRSAELWSPSALEPRNLGTQEPSLARVPIDPIHADAVHAAVSAPTADAVLVFSTRPATIASFVREGDRLRPHGRVAGGERLLSAARMVAAQLGVDDEDPSRELDRLSVGAEPEFQNELADVMRWNTGLSAITVEKDRLMALISEIGARQPGDLSDASSLNVRLQQSRRAIAASFTCRLAHVVRDAAESLCVRGGPESTAFGGAMFGNPRLNTELRRILGDGFSLATVPELAGRALGAAAAGALSFTAPGTRLLQSHPGSPADSLALGPAFSDTEIKRTLDNCRLEYVYEPARHRLFERISKMLSQGKVIGWFQGPMGFGPRAMGTRSVLTDPSGRYARHNVNEYLRQVPLDEPVPVVFTPSIASQCLTRPVSSAPGVMDAAVNSEWRDRLVGALDWRQYVRVHPLSPLHAPELCELLECHYGRTSVPALIETNLSGPGEPIACTPRDAVKTVYSSAIDALVIGQFLLLKDYWLLKSHAD